MPTTINLRQDYYIADVSECKEGLYWKVYLQRRYDVTDPGPRTITTRFRMVTPEGYLKPTPRIGLMASEELHRGIVRLEIGWLVDFMSDRVLYIEEPYPQPELSDDDKKMLDAVQGVQDSFYKKLFNTDLSYPKLGPILPPPPPPSLLTTWSVDWGAIKEPAPPPVSPTDDGWFDVPLGWPKVTVDQTSLVSS